jgi:dynein assembly factor 5
MSLQREINILAEPTSDRNSKKQALDKILKEVKNPKLDQGELILLFQSISRHVGLCFADSVEKCRELAVGIISWYDLHDKFGKTRPRSI